MKKLIFIMTMALGSSALADHTLRDAMNDSEALADAVYEVIVDNEVQCDVVNSNQQLLGVKNVKKNDELATNTIKQTALCFKSFLDMGEVEEMLKVFKNANKYSLDSREVPGVEGILVVKYKTRDKESGVGINVSEIISAEYYK